MNSQNTERETTSINVTVFRRTVVTQAGRIRNGIESRDSGKGLLAGPTGTGNQAFDVHGIYAACNGPFFIELPVSHAPRYWILDGDRVGTILCGLRRSCLKSGPRMNQSRIV